MNFVDAFYEEIASKMKSRKAQDEFIVAIVHYYYLGEEPTFKSEVADVAFAGIRYSLDKARAGRIGGQAKPEADAQAKRKAKLQANREAKAEAESEKQANLDTSTYTGTRENSPKGEQKGGDAYDEPWAESFPLQCLAAFNEVMGATYGTLPSKVERFLERNRNRYTVEDVRAMVAFKRAEWEGTEFATNLTPQTLFSPEHLEQYVHQSKMPKPKRNAKDPKGVQGNAELERIIGGIQATVIRA